MYNNFKIVCCTAAGRMRYMQYIFPYILADVLQMPCPLKGVKKSAYRKIKEWVKQKQKIFVYKFEKLRGIDYVVEEGDIFVKKGK